VSKKLIVNNGQRERELMLVGNIVVGRDPMCDISDADSLLSRRHAEFMVERENVTVRDLGSRNGVFVNGKRVAEGALQPGDVVQIGHLRLRYVEDQSALSAIVDDDDTDDPDRTNLVLPATLSADDVLARAAAAAAIAASPVAPLNRRPPAPAPAAPTEPIAAPTGPMKGSSVPQTVNPAPATETAWLTYAAPPELARPASSRSEAPTTPLSGVVRPARASHAATGSWNTFVFTRVAGLAAIVLLSSLIPVFVQRGTSVAEGGGIWLALPILVALIATYGVAALISGRTVQALTTLHEDVELAESGDLDAVSDPLGAKPTQDLANTVNRLIARLRSEAARPRNV
jgi:hypothetical protein